MRSALDGGAGEQRSGHFEAERLCGPEIDDPLRRIEMAKGQSFDAERGPRPI
jgi:hypothetical protein